MATTEKARYQPRFDFGTNVDPGETQTGTLADLLDELNYERDTTVSDTPSEATDPNSGDLKDWSLRRTLEFIRLVTGRTFVGTKEPLALTTLKTIKLLYNVNESSDRHLFNFLAPPDAVRPTMEYSTTSSMSRDKFGAAIIRSLSDQLAREIDPKKVELFNAFFPTAEHLNQRIEEVNDEIYQSLRELWGNEDLALTRSCRTLTEDITGMRYERIDGTLQTPLHEVMYCHLRSLGFNHFVTDHRSFMEDIRVKRPIHSIDESLSDLCQTLSKVKGTAVLPSDRFLSVKSFPLFVAGYHKVFRQIVRDATGLDTRKMRFLENLPRAQRFLITYAFRSYDETNGDAPVLSLIDVIAALCSVRYEQEFGTAYKPYWPAQKDQGSSPQRHLDKQIDTEDPYQHQGVLMIYLYRFYDFLHAFMGTTEGHRVWVDYQVARQDAYVRILSLQDINMIVASADYFDVICLEAASHAQTAGALT